MDPFTLALIGTAAAGAGAGTSLFGMGKSRDAQKQISAEQNRQAELARQAEALRQQQAKMVFLRSQRDILRNSQIAQSVALSRASESGAQDSSAYEGARGGILGQTGSQLGDLRGNYALGQRMSGINQQISMSQQNMVNAQGRLQEGQAYQQLGGTLFNVGLSVAGNSVQGSQVLNTLARPPGSDMGYNSWIDNTSVISYA